MSNHGHRPSATFIRNAQAFPNGFRAQRATPPPVAPTHVPVTAPEQRESMEALVNDAAREQARQEAIARHPSSHVPSPDRFDAMTRDELRAEAKRLGVSQGRNKETLLANVKAGAAAQSVAA